MRHFEVELNGLRTALLEMSGLVEAAIYRSVLALEFVAASAVFTIVALVIYIVFSYRP